MQPTGNANLPLHAGRVPAWLSARMAALGRIIVEAVVQHYGRDELLRRLSDPFWFQSFGAVMGMDWHSSGITTSVIGALKRGLAPIRQELGVFVCGGRGSHARRTPAELASMGELTGADAETMIRASRLVAKVDSALVQDGYDLYLHGFIAAADGRWCVVQQGMNTTRRQARRYHWHSELAGDFFDSPHTAIEGQNVGAIINLADRRAQASRVAAIGLIQAGPDRVIKTLGRAQSGLQPNLELFAQDSGLCANDGGTDPVQPPSAAPMLRLPMHHAIRESDINLGRLRATLAAAADRGPKDFSELLLTGGVGARTVASLAFVAEVLHGAPCRFEDPGRFSLALGGKDGHPFPVPIKVYDETISVLKRAVGNARLGRREGLDAIKRLDDQARLIDKVAAGPTFAQYIADEHDHSSAYGGRTVTSRRR